MKIRLANNNDVNYILNIIDLNNFNTTWNKNSILNYIEKNHIYLLLLKEKIITFILFNYLIDEAEIYLLATHPNYHRNNFAQKLLDFFLLKCKEKKIKYIFIEVRKKNFIAINFYIKNNFIKNNIRKNYYKNPVEDAILMKKKI